MQGISDVQEFVKDSQKWVAKIDAAVDSVKNNDLYKTLIDGHTTKFPMGILPDGADENYALVVNSVKMDATNGMMAEIFMKIPFRSGEYLYFVADRVPLSKRGKLVGDFKLMLLKSTSIKFGDGFTLVFNGLGSVGGGYDSTFVKFDCRGFKEVTLNGSLNFNENTVEEFSEDAAGKPVSLNFYLSADKLTNLLIEFHQIPDLQFKKLPGFRCSVPKITLDRSDLKNAPNFKVPGWYLDSLLIKSPSLDTNRYKSAMWEGVFIPEITIEIPKSFSEGSEADTVVVTSNDLIVDQYGISALTKATKVLKGNLKGFKYEVDSLLVNVIFSDLSQAGFYGQMAFPICKEESTVGYGLTISKGIADNELVYQGYAHLSTNLYAEAFGLAQMNLTGGRLDFEYKDKQFFPKAELDGSLTISPTKKDDTASSAAGTFGLEFNQLLLLSSAPYIDIRDPEGYLRIKEDGGNSKLANLPISLSDYELKKSQGGQRVGIGMMLSIHFQKSKGNDNSSGTGFDGQTEFTIWAKRSAASKRWGYDDFDIHSVRIGVENTTFNLKGSLEMFNGDSVYGKGFCGQVDLKIVGLFDVKTSAIFGKKMEGSEPTVTAISTAYLKGDTVQFATNNEESSISTGAVLYRYWYADAAVTFKPAIQVAPGVEINSFTGGFYNNMQMKKPEYNTGSSVKCPTVSGRKYIPNNQFLGVLAGIGLQSTGGGTAFNGDINFGLEINKTTGGINKIATWGEVGFITFDYIPSDVAAVASTMSETPVSEDTEEETEAGGKPAVDASVSAKWYVEYDFPNKTLVGDFDIYIDAVDVVTGIGEEGKAGRISVYSSPGTWYVHVGKPIVSDMIGVDVVGLVQIGGYLCFGNTLPSPPIAPMPPEIKPNINIDYNLLSMGGGLSFGARLSVGGSPGLDLGLCNSRVELRFLVKAGFDILLSQSVEPVYCEGEKRGIKNWYATGQAFLYGEAGLKVKWSCKLLGSGDEEVLTMYLAAYVFAQLPKPTYMAGGVKVGFRCLGKNFEKNFDIELGDRCQPVVSLDNEINFIEAISPADGHRDIPTGQSIIITFSNPMLNFHYTIQGGQTTETYRAFIDDAGISVSSPSGDVEFFSEFNDDMTQLVITPIRAYPGDADITVSITVTTQVKDKDDNWTNTAKTENKTITFKTQGDPGYIPLTDIYYAYPLPEMENFYISESTEGYIRLAVLPIKAVQLADNYEFNVAIFEAQNEIDRSRSVTYDGTYGQNNFTFDIPSFRLETGKQYTLKIMKSPVPTNTNQGSTQTGNVTAGIVDAGGQDTVIVEYYFKTSKYSTFNEKMALYSTSFSEVFSGVIAAELSLNDIKSTSGFENLSDAETNGYITEGTRKCDPLLQFGNLTFDSQTLQKLEGMLSSIGTIDLKNISAGTYSTVTSLIADLNSVLKDVNLQCLMSGSCSADELKAVKIPEGKFILPIGYYPPGKTTPTSVYNIVVNIESELILPQ